MVILQESIELSKRFCINILKDVLCKACNHTQVMDLSRNYLYYPKTNEVTRINYCCPNCGKEDHLNLKIYLGIELL